MTPRGSEAPPPAPDGAEDAGGGLAHGCFLASILLVLALAGCARPHRELPLFEALSPAATGISFANELPEDTSISILSYLYYYNGGGVAAGDVNGDGLPDLYFTSNRGRDRLYLNRGGFRFEDVTERAGLGSQPGWKSGVTMADVNGDGRLDLYVSAVDLPGHPARNTLWINQGDGTFREEAARYGLDFRGYSTQALFFDYDGDGDLDVYLLNHSTHAERAVGGSGDRGVRNARAGDRLYRNDGGHFVDVSEAAGIYGGVDGYGLGVVATDVNRDGCPDLYVSNDFQENDYLYVNRCDGTFRESIASATGHTSRFSMGVDAGDYDNDGLPDLMVTDMLPRDEETRRRSAGAEDEHVFDLRLRAGYHPQYSRNTLQRNRGGGRFSEVGYLAGVAATDWSWAPLFADLDNDGWKDLFVTNGVYRRPNDLDYIEYVGSAAVQASLSRGVTAENLTLLKRMPRVPLANYAFRNNGDLTFTDRAAAWGLAKPGFSNGAAYVDLDGDGALDLVVNNLDAPASIYRNRARSLNGFHYLRVVTRGEGANPGGTGATVILTAGRSRQMLEQQPTRGFESSVDPRLHFGLGRATRVDSLTVVWPDRRYQVLVNVPGDREIVLRQADARGRYAVPGPSARPLFTDETAGVAADYRHRENAFYDATREPLIPHRLSTEGPALAVGDVDGDGLDDVYAGGAKLQPGRLLLQRPDGTFRPGGDAAFRADSLAEDVDAVFLDANGDGHLDLFVVSGGNEFWGDVEPLRDRLYLNDGHGVFHRDREALPAYYENGSCVAVGDFDGDGHPDLFVGSRVVARRYGETPRSHLLRNDGRGHFVDVTARLAPGLATAGMVTSAAWGDYDGDGALDLAVVGEWTPVKLFRQRGGRFAEQTDAAGLTRSTGWWNTVTAADVNGDGRPDLVLGNLGLNSFLRASADEPVRLYVRDFARSGGPQSVLTAFRDGASYPLAGRDELLRLLPGLRSRYPTYAAFAASHLEDLFPRSELERAEVRQAETFASAVALNDGRGRFTLRPLPTLAQLAPIRAVLAGDYDGDGRTDLLVAGNFNGAAPVLGRYDASCGLLLRGDGRGGFTALSPGESGVEIEGQVRQLRAFHGAGGGTRIVAARNDDRLAFLRPAAPAGNRLSARADPAAAGSPRPAPRPAAGSPGRARG